MSVPEIIFIASYEAAGPRSSSPDNGYLGMVRQWQGLFYNNHMSAVTLDCFPDAEKLAAAYGFKGRTVEAGGTRGSTQGERRRARSVPAERESFPFSASPRWFQPVAPSTRWCSAR